MLIADGVGIRLREERDRLGLSQADFGALMGVSRGTQKNYELEAAVGALDLKYVCALEANGVDATYVLTAKHALAEGLTETESKLLSQFRIIPADDQKALLRLLRAMADDVAKQAK